MGTAPASAGRRATDERSGRRGGVLAAMLLLGGWVAAGVNGCEIAVGDSIPSFSCTPGAPGACPAGDVCVPATHECVEETVTCSATGCGDGFACDPQSLACAPSGPPSDSDATAAQDADAAFDSGSNAMRDGSSGSLDSTVPFDAGEADTGAAIEVDAKTDAESPCRGVTCTCSSPSDCDSGICADTLTVTQALYEANDSTSFCTQSCCTSGDCPGATVCFGTGAGGSYCVAPSWLGRVAPLGTGVGGASCKAPSDCRSGLCTGGACADTCCSTAQESAECSTGTVCRFASFPGAGFDTHETAWCGAATGASAGNSPCAVDGACQSGKCGTFGRCQAACRSTPDCGGAGQACVYGLGPGPIMSTKDIIAGCTPFIGAGAEGAACTTNTDCQSDFCDGAHCTDVCFSDSDCIAGWHCRPKMVSVQSGGSYSVLSCQG